MNTSTSNRISAKDAWSALEADRTAQLVDVREPVEYLSIHVEGSISAPLSKLSTSLDNIEKEKDVFLLCRSGARAGKAAEILLEKGFSSVSVIEGGLSSWEQANLPVIKSCSGVWSMDRQVRFVAGTLVLTGIALSVSVNHSWLMLSGFVAIGMMFSAISNTCGMATILSLMPWNK